MKLLRHNHRETVVRLSPEDAAALVNELADKDLSTTAGALAAALRSPADVLITRYLMARLCPRARAVAYEAFLHADADPLAAALLKRAGFAEEDSPTGRLFYLLADTDRTATTKTVDHAVRMLRACKITIDREDGTGHHHG
jgi:hypothetical protein